MKKCLALFCLLSSCVAFAASFAPIFQDNMVVQRDVVLPVWGTAKPHEALIISWQEETKKVVADASGAWRVDFLANPANSTASTLTLKDESSTTVLSNILVGDVWLASGQSNMEWVMHQFTDGRKDYSQFGNDSLRFMQMRSLLPTDSKPYQIEQYEKAEKGGFFEARWMLCEPQSVKDFSAVAAYFGRALQQEVQVPIGVICNALGGVGMETWLPKKLINSDERFAYLRKDDWMKSSSQYYPAWKRERAKQNLRLLQTAGKVEAQHPFRPTFLYEYALKPLLPFPVKGVIWYQGESNAQVNSQEVNSLLLKELILSWRKAYDNPSLPFYMVQLPRIKDNTAMRAYWAQFREVQQAVADGMEGVELICALDLGMPNADVHPSPKGPVGERLCGLVLYHSYGMQEGMARGVSPRITGVQWGDKSATLSVSAAIKCNDGQSMRGFVYVSADKKKHIPLQGKLTDDGKAILLDLPESPQKGAEIRYHYSTYAEPNLVSVEGNLPLFPWRKER